MHFDSGNVARMLTATLLVMMTQPWLGLAPTSAIMERERTTPG